MAGMQESRLCAALRIADIDRVAHEAPETTGAGISRKRQCPPSKVNPTRVPLGSVTTFRRRLARPARRRGASSPGATPARHRRALLPPVGPRS